MQPLKIGILTVSDRAARGVYEDRGGPAIEDYLRRHLASEWIPVKRVIEDDGALIEQSLIAMEGEEGCGLILTTGGTGPAPRDLTPEATEAVVDRLMPGFGEEMRRVSQTIVPTGILSRQTAGQRKQCLIINLPGKPSAIGDCLDAVLKAVPYCLDLIGAARMDLVGGTFRPGESPKKG